MRRLATGVVLALALALPTPASAAFGYLGEWGSLGSADGQFMSPSGVAVDTAGNVYVTDGNQRVQKFTSTGTFVRKWGAFGSGNGELRHPRGIAVSPTAGVYVADRDNHRVQRFDTDGNYLSQQGASGSGDGEFLVPGDVATGSRLYVADGGNFRIQRFQLPPGPPFEIGAYAKWGSNGPGDGQFKGANGVALDAAGNVYVSDAGNNRVQKFTADGSFLTKWGSSGTGDNEFTNPFGIDVDPAGNVYVVDNVNGSVQKFSSGGTFLARFGGPESGPGQLQSPAHVASDSSGNVYVTDLSQDRVVRFGELAGPGPSPPPVADRNAPTVSGLRASPTRFVVVAGRRADAGRKRLPRGTTFRFRLSEDATVRLRIERATRGRRAKGKCRRATRRNRRGRRCVRYVRHGELVFQGRAGANRRSFSGRIKRRKLRPARYRAIVVARDAAGNASRPARTSFRVLKP